MDTETILTWNATNWITVLLMVLVGWIILLGAVKLVKGPRRDEKGD
jgi:hypothetical protein